MKVLIVGGGGREHAIGWKLHGEGVELVAAPGNPGLATIASCRSVPVSDIEALAALAKSERVDWTFVGPEGPLAAGLVDRFRALGLAAFGPTAGAAKLESSKRFAKEVMLRAGVPTAHATWHTSEASAVAAIHALGAPVVIKASGLAAGKGVVVAGSTAEAIEAVHAMLQGRIHGDAGTEILVEEFMQGEELSVFTVTDGTIMLPMLPAQDHKRLLDGDGGPNTGGMGAYAPVSIGGRQLTDDAQRLVFEPTLRAMREAGTPFAGLLYAGLMLTPTGLRVVEFNCRFGDPETQALLPLLESPLAPALAAVATGSGLAGAAQFRWSDGASVCSVLASEGYPEKPVTGAAITLPDIPDGVFAFHAGTRRSATGALEVAGGRVLNMVGTGRSMAEALGRSTSAGDAVLFHGKQMRRDIGWREMRRAGAS